MNRLQKVADEAPGKVSMRRRGVRWCDISEQRSLYKRSGFYRSFSPVFSLQYSLCFSLLYNVASTFTVSFWKGRSDDDDAKMQWYKVVVAFFCAAVSDSRADGIPDTAVGAALCLSLMALQVLFTSRVRVWKSPVSYWYYTQPCDNHCWGLALVTGSESW